MPKPGKAMAMKVKKLHLVVCCSRALLGPSPSARSIRSSSFLGPDHKIIVDAHVDPRSRRYYVLHRSCQDRGHQGGLGLAEDKSEASIACRQVGPISFARPLPRQRRSSTSDLAGIQEAADRAHGRQARNTPSISLTPIA
jgi:catabolite regulation protein CreA